MPGHPPAGRAAGSGSGLFVRAVHGWPGSARPGPTQRYAGPPLRAGAEATAGRAVGAAPAPHELPGEQLRVSVALSTAEGTFIVGSPRSPPDGLFSVTEGGRGARQEVRSRCPWPGDAAGQSRRGSAEVPGAGGESWRDAGVTQSDVLPVLPLGPSASCASPFCNCISTYRTSDFGAIHDITGRRLIQCCGKARSVLLLIVRVMVAVDPARYIHVALQIRVVKDMHGKGSGSTLAAVWIRE